MVLEANKARGTPRERIQRAEDRNIVQENKTKEMNEARDSIQDMKTEFS